MSDVFVSYASADRDKAKVVADAMAAAGWSVWWDRTIPPGKEFDQVIEEALDAAKCVVVLWSHASVASSWVKTEAAEAMRRKVLVPALIEDVKIPLEFRRLQAADLSEWHGESSHAEFQKFCQSVKEHIHPSSPRSKPAPEPPPRRRAETAPTPQSTRPRSGNRKVLVWGVVTLILIGAGAMGYTVYSDYVNHADLQARIRLEEARTQAERRRTTEAAYESARSDASDVPEASQRGTVRAKAARERVPRAGAERFTMTSYSNTMEWRDHALRYSGTVKWSPTEANMKVAVYDLVSGVRIGNYDLPATVSKEGPFEYIVSADFQVPRDSVSPYPHVHTVNLSLEVRDGLPRLIENCPRPGECY